MIILRVSSTQSADMIVLPMETISRFGFKEGDKVILTAAPGGVRVTRHTSDIERQVRAAEEIMTTDHEILRRLSK